MERDLSQNPVQNLTEFLDVFDLYRMAELYLAADDPRSAIANLEQARAAEPGDPAIERLLATAYYRFASLGRAEELLRAIVERDPADVASTNLLGRTLVRRGRTVEARPYLRLAAAMDPVTYSSDPAVLQH